jgi:hypothetical protein
MKATGNILQRYSNLPKTKVVGGVGQASRLPWRNKASQARRLRYTGRAPSYAILVPGYYESRGCQIYPKQSLGWITG